MDTEQTLKKYKERVSRIGRKKAFLWALVIGSACEFIAALVIWFLNAKVSVAILIMVGVLILVTLVATPVIYTLFYKPTKKRVAQMIDRLGYEERFITMCEYENDNSYVAKLQREDAKEKLKSVNEKQFIFRLSKVGVVALAISLSLGIVMGMVSVFSKSGLIPGGNVIFAQDNDDTDEEGEEPDDSLCIIVYMAGEGGIVSGEIVQRLHKGENTKPVIAMPDMGYEFAGWSDGYPGATRVDYNVLESATYTAMFVKSADIVMPGVGGDGAGAGDGAGGDVNSGDVGLGGGAGGSGNSGEMDGDDVNGEAGGGAGAMKDKEDNSVIDGSSDYKYVFDYEAEIKALLEDETLSDEVKDFLSKYLEALKQMQDADKGSE